jgi:hypothetical protein
VALTWDDTRAANFLVLGEALQAGPTPDRVGARTALEAAFALEPSNAYVVDRLRELYWQLADTSALASLLRRALAAGMPISLWDPSGTQLETDTPLQESIAG